MFCQHSAESATCCVGVRYECSRDGFIVGLGGPCCKYQVSSYLLRSVSIILENSGEKFQFLGEGNLVTESLGSVYHGSQDWLFVCTHTKFCLHQNSHHCPANKQSVLDSLLLRARALCDQESLTQELEFFTTVFQG